MAQGRFVPRTGYRFDGFTIDLRRGALLDAGGAERWLRPKSFALLLLFVENAGRLLDRDTIMETIWPGVFVTEDSITQCVRDIRRALGSGAQRLLRTVPRRGYALDARVSRADPEGPSAVEDGGPFLVILPFANQCEDDWFADGVTEELITTMARLLPRAGSVIARGTSFALRGKVGDPREMGHELGVRYALDGRVRRWGGRVRIVAELVDTATGAIAWTQAFDGDRADPDLLRDEIVARIGNTLCDEMATAAGERARRKAPHEIVADDLAMQGWAMFYRPRSVGQLKAACDLFEQAVAADRCPGDASVGFSLTHT